MEKDLFAEPPKAVDLFAEAPTQDLFASQEEDLFADLKGPSLGETVASLPERFSLGLHRDFRNAQRLFSASIEDVDPEQLATYQAYPESPAAKEYFRRREENEQLKREQRTISGAMQEVTPANAHLSTTDQVLGGATESLGSSLAAAGAFALTGNPLPAMAIGGGGGFLAEAGGIREEALAAGATPDQAGRVAGFGGVVAGAADVFQLGHMIKGASPLALGARYAATEYPSEAVPSALTNVAGNIEGYQSKGFGEILSEANIEGLAGLVGAGVVAPPMALVDRSRRGEALKGLEAKLQEALQAQAKITGMAEAEVETLLGTVVDPADQTSVPRVQLTSAQTQLAEIEARQVAEASTWETTEAGKQFGESLNIEWIPPQLDVGGVSDEVHANRVERYQGETVLLGQKIIQGASDTRVTGLRLEQLEQITPGLVTAVSSGSAQIQKDFPPEYVQWLVKNTKEWVDKFAPNMKVVINLEQLDPDGHSAGAFGHHQIVAGDIHVLNPRELTSLQDRYGGGDVRTRASAQLGYAHEFGHALKMQKFFEGISEDMRFPLREAIKTGQLSPELTQALQGTVEGALLADWQSHRARVISGEMTAREFMEKWVGVRKLGFGVLRQKSEGRDSMIWATERLAKLGISLEAATAMDLIRAGYMAPRSDFKSKASYEKGVQVAVEYALNFEEYMAEQYSRAALQRDLFSKNRTIKAWFNDALTTLRKYFTYLKRNKIIEASVPFNAWLDSLSNRALSEAKHPRTRISRGLQEKRKVLLADVKAKQAADLEAKRAAKELKVAEEEGIDTSAAAARAPDVEELPAAEDTAPPVEQVAALRDPTQSMLEYLDNALKEGFVEKDSKVAGIIRSTIINGNFELARTLLDRQIDKGRRFDLEYTTRALEALEGKEELTKKALGEIQRRPDIAKGDQLAIAAVMAKYPKGVPIPIEALEEEVANLTFPIGVEEGEMVPQFSWLTPEYGFDRIWNQAAQYALGGVREVFTLPFRSFANTHFANPNYLAHYRARIMGGTLKVVEIQSDLLQGSFERKLSEIVDDSVVQAEGLRQDTWNTLASLRYEREALRGFLQATEDGNQEYLDGFADEWGPMTPEQAKDWLTKNQAMYDKLAVSEEDSQPQEEALKNVRKLKMYRPVWERSILQKVTGRAYVLGVQKLSLATADTMAKGQGWAKYQTIFKEGMALNGVAIAGLELITAVTLPVRLKVYYPDGATQLMDMGELNPTVSLALLRTFKTVPANYGDQQVIYDRYMQSYEVEARLRYNAQETTDEFGNTWLEWNADKRDKKETRWDRDNPLSPNINEVTPAQVAGLTDEQLASESVIAQATELWQKKNWQSPFFQRWFQGSKATMYDGTPLQLWAGLGSTLQAIQTGTDRITWFHTARDNAVSDAVFAGWKDNPAAAVQNYALRMQAPLMKSAGGQPLNDILAKQWIQEAKAKGRDGLIINDVRAPHLGSLYAVFSPEDAKALLNVGTFDETDRVHWDLESPIEAQAYQGTKAIWKLAKGLYPGNWPLMMRAAARAMDAVIQLQQRVGTALPDGTLDKAIGHFGKLMQLANRMKNNLQVDGEQFAKVMQRLGKSDYEMVSKLITNEFKSGIVLTEVVRLDTPEIRHEHRPTELWVEYLEAQGLDVSTPNGERLGNIILEYKNVIQGQLDALHRTFEGQLQDRLQNQPNLLQVELAKLDAIMQKYRETPFVPQGRYGDFVLVVRKSVYDTELGRRKEIVVRQQHFETESARRKVYLKMKSLEASGPYTVKTQDLKGYSKSLMMVPSDMLQYLATTQSFSDEQLETLAETLHMPTWQKLEQRYDSILSKVEGAEPDILRNLANFVWHNSNFVWKTYYRKGFTKAILWEQQEIRDLERIRVSTPEEADHIAEMVNFRRRNEAIMGRVQESVLYPEEEWQQARMAVSLVYLAYNIKTAALNVTTQILTANAVTSQYGEVNGARWWAMGQADFLSIPWLDKRIAASSAGEAARLQDVKQALDRAVREGVLDPSYAFFLAGQANGFDLSRAFKRSHFGRYAHGAVELGMAPFRGMELWNRYHAFLTFYNAERGEGRNSQAAYTKAVEQVNLTQNSFTQDNKPELFRGRKSILLVFASFTQFMMYHALGGYERQARAKNAQEIRDAIANERPIPRKHANILHGETIKMYAVYLWLAGLAGVPFGEDLMNIAGLFWKKLYPEKKDLETVLRGQIKDIGGNPDRWLHGWTHDLWGFDISGSVGLGRLLPFASGLTREFKSFEEGLGYGVLGMAGPTGGVVQDAFKIAGMGWELAKGGPITGGEMLKELPGALGGMGRGLDAHYKQKVFPGHGVVTKSGESLTRDPVTGEPRNLNTKEIVGTLLNVQTTIVSQNRERNNAENMALIYWHTRRGSLTSQMVKARTQLQDAQAIESMWKRIDDYNEQVPEQGLKITRKDISEAVLAANRNRNREERGTQKNIPERRIKEDVGSVYGVSPAPSE